MDTKRYQCKYVYWGEESEIIKTCLLVKPPIYPKLEPSLWVRIHKKMLFLKFSKVESE